MRMREADRIRPGTLADAVNAAQAVHARMSMGQTARSESAPPARQSCVASKSRPTPGSLAVAVLSHRMLLMQPTPSTACTLQKIDDVCEDGIGPPKTPRAKATWRPAPAPKDWVDQRSSLHERVVTTALEAIESNTSFQDSTRCATPRPMRRSWISQAADDADTNGSEARSNSAPPSVRPPSARWLKVPFALFDDTAPSVRLVPSRAQAAPTHPIPQPERPRKRAVASEA